MTTYTRVDTKGWLVIPKKNQRSILVIDPNGEVYKLVVRADTGSLDYDGYGGNATPSAYAVAKQYFDNYPVAAPAWHSAKEGELWVVTRSNGETMNALVSDKNFVYSITDGVGDWDVECDSIYYDNIKNAKKVEVS